MKRVIALVFVIVTWLFILICHNGDVEQKTMIRETSVGLPIGNQYIYKMENRHVKILIESPEMWLVQTEEMNFSEKMNVKELKQIQKGVYLTQFSANNIIRANDAFIVSTEKERLKYYIVINDEGFYLVPDYQLEDYDIRAYAENVNVYFIKQ